MVKFLLGEGVLPDRSTIKEADRPREARGLSLDDRWRAWRIQKKLLDVVAARDPATFAWANNMGYGLEDESIKPSGSGLDSEDDDRAVMSSDGEWSSASAE